MNGLFGFGKYMVSINIVIIVWCVGLNVLDIVYLYKRGREFWVFVLYRNEKVNVLNKSNKWGCLGCFWVWYKVIDLVILVWFCVF